MFIVSFLSVALWRHLLSNNLFEAERLFFENVAVLIQLYRTETADHTPFFCANDALAAIARMNTLKWIFNTLLKHQDNAALIHEFAVAHLHALNSGRIQVPFALYILRVQLAIGIVNMLVMICSPKRDVSIFALTDQAIQDLALDAMEAVVAAMLAEQCVDLHFRSPSLYVLDILIVRNLRAIVKPFLMDSDQF